MAGGAIPANLAPIFIAAGHANHIPPAILAGVSSVESNLFRNTGPSSAGAVGGMQFEPATAKALGINPNDPRQAIFGAAKLLNQYGYQQNPLRALGAYNGGPGNPQYGYARQVVSEAKRLGGQLSGTGALGRPSVQGLGAPPAQQQQSLSQIVPTFDQAGYNKANARYIAGSFISGQKNPFDIGPKGADLGPNPLFSPGGLTTTAPNAADFQGTKTIQLAQSSLQRLAGGSVLNAHPQLQGQKLANIAGGFLPRGAKYVVGRKDQGRDGQTNPGGPIVANGNGYVVNVLSDPNGFGPKYPLVHFVSGPYAGRTLYFGHTLSTVKPGQRVSAGQVISRTGTSGVGNATVPGWFEIGFADSGSPGRFGQAVPF